MIRISTLLFGVICVLVSVGVLLATLTSWRLDVGLTALLVLTGTGVAMLAGAAVSSLRARR